MSKRKKRLEGKIGLFVQQYRRKRHKGHDPNDRMYDRRIERKIKGMDPEELDELMHGGSREEERGSDLRDENPGEDS